MRTYRCNVVEELAQEADNVVHVLVSFDKTQSLAPCQLTDDVKGEELQPLTEVAALPSLGKHILGFVEPVCECGANERLVVDERAHGEGIVDASAVLCVKVFVGGGEEREERRSLGHGALDRVKVRLEELAIIQQTYLHLHTL